MGRKLTANQVAFVERVVSGLNPTVAARDVGYQHAPDAAYRLMRLPHVLKAIRERRQAMLDGDMTTLAFDTLRELMTDKDNVPASTRYKASELTLKMGRWVNPDADTSAKKDLSEMDADELSAAIASGMQALTELAGQLEGHHVIDGAAVPIKDVPAVLVDEAETPGFLD